MQYEPLQVQPIVMPVDVDWPAVMLLLVTAGITVRVVTGLGFWFVHRLEERFAGKSTRQGGSHLHARLRTTRPPIGSGPGGGS